MRRALLALLMLVAPSLARDLTYPEILAQLGDFDRLMLPQTGIEAGQFSSWHRDERTSWGINADAGNYLRDEPSGEVVMMEQEGPGCIYRVWSANPMGTIRLYLDGATVPSYEFEFIKLFDGSTAPFLEPLCWRRGADVMNASNCYLPIPFAKSIKITQDQRRGQFYIFNYLKYPEDWNVPSFRLPLSAAEERALDAARDVWRRVGADPKPTLAGQTAITRTLTLAPGATTTLCDLRGGGQIRAIKIKATSAQRYVWRKLVLRGTFDGAAEPQILTPLGPFFAFDWQTADYKSLPAGCVDGEGYFYYPMPYRRGARLQLQSYLELPAEIRYTVEYAAVPPPADALYFHCRWRTEKDSTTFDYPFIETAGSGHLVGCALQIDHPIPGWWGEGDEKIWIDDDQFPRWIGTGSEDYFGDAWGIRYLPGQSWGCSAFVNPRTSPYRWHFMDLVPFAKRLRVTIENYGCWGDHRHELEYNSTAYWYQAEAVPPFDQLRGQTYVGGNWQDTPHQRPWNPETYRPIRAGDLLTHGLNIPSTIEAEAILGGQPGIELVTDARRPYEFSVERAVRLRPTAAGQVVARFDLPIAEANVYYPTLYTAPEPGVELSLKIGEQVLEPIGRPQPNQVELAGLYLEAGRHPAELVAAGPGEVILDALGLQRAQRAGGVMEAESLRVTGTTGGTTQPVTVRGFSAGRALLTSAEAPGAAVVLQLGQAPKQPYVLGARMAVGGAGVRFQAYAGGQAIGPVLDTYADGGPRPSDWIYRLGALPPGVDTFELRVLGKDDRSIGYHLGIDYFVWEPEIIHADSTPGVSAVVAGTAGCSYQIQDLGPAFSAGHHLWVQPSSPEAVIEISVSIPADGVWELETKLTTSWDYAIVQTLLDGTRLGEPVDCYTATVLSTPPLALGRHRLTAGNHLVRFQSVGRNPASAGHLMGIDYLKLTRVE